MKIESSAAKLFITSKWTKNGERVELVEGPRIYAVDWDSAEAAIRQVDPEAWIEGRLITKEEDEKIQGKY